MDCDICFEDYNQGERSPKIMPCGHTVCLQCLLQVGKRECPTCRTVYSVDAGSLTTNIALLRLSADVKVPRGWCSDCRGSATDECWNEHDVVLVQRALKRQLHGVAIQAAGYLEKLQDQCKGEQALTALSLLSRESCKLSVQAGEKLLTGTVRNTEDPLVKAMWLVLAAKANFTEERQTESPQPAGASSSLASTQRPIKGPLGHGMDLNKFVFCGPETKQEEKAATLKAVRGWYPLHNTYKAVRGLASYVPNLTRAQISSPTTPDSQENVEKGDTSGETFVEVTRE